MHSGEAGALRRHCSASPRALRLLGPPVPWGPVSSGAPVHLQGNPECCPSPRRNFLFLCERNSMRRKCVLDTNVSLRVSCTPGNLGVIQNPQGARVGEARHVRGAGGRPQLSEEILRGRPGSVPGAGAEQVGGPLGPVPGRPRAPARRPPADAAELRLWAGEPARGTV